MQMKWDTWLTISEMRGAITHRFRDNNSICVLLLFDGQAAQGLFWFNPTSVCSMRTPHLLEGASTDPDKDPSPLTNGCLSRWVLF